MGKRITIKVLTLNQCKRFISVQEHIAQCTVLYSKKPTIILLGLLSRLWQICYFQKRSLAMNCEIMKQIHRALTGKTFFSYQSAAY